VTFDLLNTKDTGLAGAVGETIAWQYLWRNGMIAFSFGLGRPWFIGKMETDEVKSSFDRFLEHPWLTKRQLDYLANLKEKGPRRWDFVATRLRDIGKKRRTIYLVEVKVKRQGKSRHDLRGSLKGKIPEDLEKAKSLGFVPLLLIVDLLDNWEFEVTTRGL
jgi:hypothetical protein